MLPAEPELGFEAGLGGQPSIRSPEPDCPIIIITGYPDSALLDRILAKGPITVLKKPLSVHQLKEAVRILGHKDAIKLAA